VKPETVIENKVVHWAESRGLVAIKLQATRGARTGWPDRLFVLPGGEHVYVEFKVPGAVPTPLQLRRHEQLRALGATVWVEDDAQQAIKRLQLSLLKSRI
jgi:hypothetical protein